MGQLVTLKLDRWLPDFIPFGMPVETIWIEFNVPFYTFINSNSLKTLPIDYTNLFRLLRYFVQERDTAPFFQ